MSDIPLNEVIHFDCTTHNPVTGAVTDADSTPSFSVFEEDTDTPIVTGTFTKRTALTGDYRGSVSVTAVNGFDVGKMYNIVATGVVTANLSGTPTAITGKAIISRFRVTAAETVAGLQDVNTLTISNGAITAASIAAAALNGKGDWNTTTPPTASAVSAQVAADLLAAHGAGSWQTATGFSTPADVAQVVTDLAAAHGAGSWLTATGFSTPADVTQAVADLATAHGAGSWQTATGFSTPADVNAQLLDVLTVDVFSELSAPPAANSSLKDKLTWLFMWARNKATESLTQRKLYADDTTTVVSTETLSDAAGTFTKGEQS